MNKQEIFDHFAGAISRSAIRQRNDEWVVFGKWAIVSPDDENGQVWDVWVCNPKNIREGLGQRKVRNIARSFKSPTGTLFQELIGESWAKVAKEDVIGNIALLGIRKSRVLSEETRQRLAEQLRKNTSNPH